jgi:hypothetical protein
VLDSYLDRRKAEQVGCKEGEEKCDVYRCSRSKVESKLEHSNSSTEETDVGEETDIGEEIDVNKAE